MRGNVASTGQHLIHQARGHAQRRRCLTLCAVCCHPLCQLRDGVNVFRHAEDYEAIGPTCQALFRGFAFFFGADGNLATSVVLAVT